MNIQLIHQHILFITKQEIQFITNLRRNELDHYHFDYKGVLATTSYYAFQRPFIHPFISSAPPFPSLRPLCFPSTPLFVSHYGRWFHTTVWEFPHFTAYGAAHPNDTYFVNTSKPIRYVSVPTCTSPEYASKVLPDLVSRSNFTLTSPSFVRACYQVETLIGITCLLGAIKSNCCYGP